MRLNILKTVNTNNVDYVSHIVATISNRHVYVPKWSNRIVESLLFSDEIDQIQVIWGDFSVFFIEFAMKNANIMVLLIVYALGQKIVNINESTNSETLIPVRRSLWKQISQEKVDHLCWIFL